MTAPAYQRLTRRRRTFAGSSQIWLAGDHLLLVVRYWFTESYHRFRFADIQSIVVSERPSRLTLQLVCLLLSASVFVVTLIPPSGLKTLAAAPVGLLLIWQAVDLLRGRYCRVQLNTAVSSMRFPALSRVGAARRFLERVTPVIEHAQSSLSVQPPPLTEPPSVPGEQPSAVPAPFDSVALPPAVPLARAPVLPTILAACTLVLGCLGLGFLWGNLPSDLASLAWMLSFAAILLAATVIVTEKNIHASVRTLAILIALVGIVDVVVSFTVLYQTVKAARSADVPRGAALRNPLVYRWGPVICFTEIGLGVAGLAAAILTRPRAGTRTTA